MNKRKHYLAAGLLSLSIVILCAYFIKVQNVTGLLLLALLAVGLLASFTTLAFFVSSLTKHPKKTLDKLFDFFDTFIPLP